MRVTGDRPFNPGLARQAVVWQRKAVSGQDSYGQDTYVWRDVLAIQARVRALQGRELDSARQTWAEARYKVEHQYYPGLEREMRVYFWDGAVNHYLEVLDVQDAAGTGLQTTAICKEWAE